MTSGPFQLQGRQHKPTCLSTAITGPKATIDALILYHYSTLTGTVPTQAKWSSPFLVGNHTEQDFKVEGLPCPPPTLNCGMDFTPQQPKHTSLEFHKSIDNVNRSNSNMEPSRGGDVFRYSSFTWMITRIQSSEQCSLFVILLWGIFFIFYNWQLFPFLRINQKSSPLCSRSNLDNC